VKEIMEKAVKSELSAYPHVKIWELSGDESLFTKSPEGLSSLRRGLLRSSLKFFAEMSNFYEELFKRMGIDPGSAELEDLVKLALPSDLLRGEGYKRFLIEQVKSEPG